MVVLPLLVLLVLVVLVLVCYSCALPCGCCSFYWSCSCRRRWRGSGAAALAAALVVATVVVVSVDIVMSRAGAVMVGLQKLSACVRACQNDAPQFTSPRSRGTEMKRLTSKALSFTMYLAFAWRCLQVSASRQSPRP